MESESIEHIAKQMTAARPSRGRAGHERRAAHGVVAHLPGGSQSLNLLRHENAGA